ncbi:molybdate ABC transporter substrate-binding protein [Paenibacillus tarimensis]
MFRKNKRSMVSLIIFITIIIAGCAEHSEEVDLIVSAAASLTDALKDIQKLYESGHPNIKINYNFGSSGALQQQIEQGAPADLFLSAASRNMKALTDKELIEADRQTNLLNNELVVVIAADREAAIEEAADLTDEKIRYVAIGIPESVPAGSYAKEALTGLHLWDKLQPKMVQGKDVRQVLQYVETGNADAGFVYKSDALTSDKVRIAFTVDPKTYSIIEYPIGVVKTSKHSREAEDFYLFLQSREALNVFAEYGFSFPER